MALAVLTAPNGTVAPADADDTWQVERLSYRNGCSSQAASWAFCFRGKVRGAQGKNLFNYHQVGYCDDGEPRWRNLVRETTTVNGVFDFLTQSAAERRKFRQKDHNPRLDYDRPMKARVLIPGSATFRAYVVEDFCTTIGGS